MRPNWNLIVIYWKDLGIFCWVNSVHWERYYLKIMNRIKIWTNKGKDEIPLIVILIDSFVVGTSPSVQARQWTIWSSNCTHLTWSQIWDIKKLINNAWNLFSFCGVITISGYYMYVKVSVLANNTFGFMCIWICEKLLCCTVESACFRRPTFHEKI